MGRTFKNPWKKYNPNKPSSPVKKKKVKPKPKPVKRNFNGSKGECKISQLLIELNIKFIQEKVFKDCRNPLTNCPLRFDFYVPSHNTCIEYDGKHHSMRLKGQTEDQFKSQLFRDGIKNQYCIDKGIKLIRIPSTQYKKLDKIIKTIFLN